MLPRLFEIMSAFSALPIYPDMMKMQLHDEYGPIKEAELEWIDLRGRFRQSMIDFNLYLPLLIA